MAHQLPRPIIAPSQQWCGRLLNCECPVRPFRRLRRSLAQPRRAGPGGVPGDHDGAARHRRTGRAHGHLPDGPQGWLVVGPAARRRGLRAHASVPSIVSPRLRPGSTAPRRAAGTVSWHLLSLDRVADRARRERVRNGLGYLGYAPLRDDTWISPRRSDEVDALLQADDVRATRFVAPHDGDDATTRRRDLGSRRARSCLPRAGCATPQRWSRVRCRAATTRRRS